MKAIVCGGRNVGRVSPRAFHLAAEAIKRASAERRLVSNKLDELHSANGLCEIVGGAEGGAERLGTQWARAKGVRHKIYHRAKGESVSERNRRMLYESKPDLVIAFSGGPSTSALIADATALGVQIVEVSLTPPPGSNDAAAGIGPAFRPNE